MSENRKTLDELLAQAKAYVDSLTPEQYRTMIEEQKKSWLRAELAFARDERTVALVTSPAQEPADAEREELAKWLLARSVPDRDCDCESCAAYKRIAALLRSRPVEAEEGNWAQAEAQRVVRDWLSVVDHHHLNLRFEASDALQQIIARALLRNPADQPERGDDVRDASVPGEDGE